MRGWTEAENVKAKRFPGMKIELVEREKWTVGLSSRPRRGTLTPCVEEERVASEKNGEWRDGLNVSNIRSALKDPRESRVRSSPNPPHITAPFQAA